MDGAMILILDLDFGFWTQDPVRSISHPSKIGNPVKPKWMAARTDLNAARPSCATGGAARRGDRPYKGSHSEGVRCRGRNPFSLSSLRAGVTFHIRRALSAATLGRALSGPTCTT